MLTNFLYNFLVKHRLTSILLFPMDDRPIYVKENSALCTEPIRQIYVKAVKTAFPRYVFLSTSASHLSNITRTSFNQDCKQWRVIEVCYHIC